MVRGPRLLILDEPCQGLDPGNRKQVLGLIDRIAEKSDTRLLYVTHHEDELPKAVTRTLRLPPARPETSPRTRAFRKQTGPDGQTSS